MQSLEKFLPAWQVYGFDQKVKLINCFVLLQGSALSFKDTIISIPIIYVDGTNFMKLNKSLTNTCP